MPKSKPAPLNVKTDNGKNVSSNEKIKNKANDGKSSNLNLNDKLNNQSNQKISNQESTPETPPPIQLQKKKKLSFRQRLSRCGSECKAKISKKNSNEMELENSSNVNNENQASCILNQHKPLSATSSTNSSIINNSGTFSNKNPNKTDEIEIELEAANSSNSASKQNASNLNATDSNNKTNLDANHCARNFFCWCCSCCSCLKMNFANCSNSNLAFDQNFKENSSLAINNLEFSFSEHLFFADFNENAPSLDEIRSWSESFDKLIRCRWGRSVFRQFLKREFSEENILFWLACEDLKNEDSMCMIEEKARFIYESFISILSPKEVSLDSKVREVINKNMLKPSKTTFEEAQLQIYTLMQRDSYPRFINSDLYRNLAELPILNKKSSIVV